MKQMGRRAGGRADGLRKTNGRTGGLGCWLAGCLDVTDGARGKEMESDVCTSVPVYGQRHRSCLFYSLTPPIPLL